MKSMKQKLAMILIVISLLQMNPVLGVADATEKKHTAETENVAEADRTEEPPATGSLEMHYDDCLDMTGKTFRIIDRGTPSSCRVGFGVEEGVRDVAVVSRRGNDLVASGIGTARVSIDDEIIDITVTAAPISLFLLIGQSNMEGFESDPGQSVVCPTGQVYATYGSYGTLNIYSAPLFAPSALAGKKREINTLGTEDKLSNFPVYSLTEAGAGKMGPDSGLAYEWNRITGEKVWIVNAAHSGAELDTYMKGRANYEEAVALFSACQKTMQREIAAGHFTLSHMGYFWCHGCNDSHYAAEKYANKFLAMHDNLKNDLSIDMDGDPETPENTLEFGNIILALAGYEKINGYRRGLYTQDIQWFYYFFRELEMRGHRVAQLWMGANPDLPDIHVVCNIADSWLWMPDRKSGVEAFFKKRYEGGRVDYQPQVPQEDSWYTPTRPEHVKNFVHYRQIGYNEIGIEAAWNTCILLGYLNDTEEDTSVRFVDWSGFEEVSRILPSTVGKSETLVVPIVSPVYRSKSVSYSVSEGLSYQYYDLITEPGVTEGTLSVNENGGPSVLVTESATG